MELKIKSQEVRTVLNGVDNGFDVTVEFNKVGDSPVDFVGFSAYKESSSITGGYYLNGNQFNVNVSSYEEGFSEIIENLFIKCVEVASEITE